MSDAAATPPEKQTIVEEGQTLHASPMANEHVNSRFGDYIPDEDFLVHRPAWDDVTPQLGEARPPGLQTKKPPRPTPHLAKRCSSSTASATTAAVCPFSCSEVCRGRIVQSRTVLSAEPLLREEEAKVVSAGAKCKFNRKRGKK